MDGSRVRVCLGVNGPLGLPFADSSSVISRPRAPAPGVSACAATHKRKTESACGQACDPSPAWPGGLRGEIKEEASAARRMPGDIRPEGLQVASGLPDRGEPRDQAMHRALRPEDWRPCQQTSGRRAQTLKRKCSTSPSWTRYSLPSRRRRPASRARSEEHTSELQSLMRISYAVFRLKKKT